MHLFKLILQYPNTSGNANEKINSAEYSVKRLQRKCRFTIKSARATKW